MILIAHYHAFHFKSLEFFCHSYLRNFKAGVSLALIYDFGSAHASFMHVLIEFPRNSAGFEDATVGMGTNERNAKIKSRLAKMTRT